MRGANRPLRGLDRLWVVIVFWGVLNSYKVRSFYNMLTLPPMSSGTAHFGV
jgi:hypothetical protein